MSQLARTSDEPASTPGVPFLDLASVNGAVRDEVMSGLEGLLDTGAFTNGAAVGAFEREFAGYCGSPYCIGVANGLDALRLGLLASGLERGDEVIVPANTFVATFEAVTQAGGAPVVVDVTDADYNIDPQAVAAAVGSRTRFLLPVHLYGQLADMTAIGELASKHGLTVLEDAAQAHGATRDGHRAGSSGDLAAFSFYPAKNLGAFGDAGALTTGDQDVDTRMRALREHGQLAKYRYTYEGYTARLDTFQAIVLSAKLARLDEGNAGRRAVAAGYAAGLVGVGDLTLPPVAAGSDPVWHVYVVRTADPAGLAAYLAERSIGTGRHYPEPPHLSEAYAWLGHPAGSFPVTEAICTEGLSLPLFPGMTTDQLDQVCDAVRAYFDRG